MLKRQRNILLVTFLVVVLALVGIIYKTSIKPTITVPRLNDVRSIQVEFNSTETNPKAIPVDSSTLSQPDGRVLPASKRSDEYVDIQTSGSNKMIRYYSPKLASWLNGGWKNDWKQ